MKENNWREDAEASDLDGTCLRSGSLSQASWHDFVYFAAPMSCCNNRLAAMNEGDSRLWNAFG